MRNLTNIKICHLIFILLLIVSRALAQKSDPALFTRSLLTGNNIGLSAFNDGQIACINLGDITGEWPLGSGENYIGDIIPCLGIELPIKDYNNDGKQDTIHSVIISRGPRRGQFDERHPTLNYFRGFNPLKNTRNPNVEGFALSNTPNTWPSNWSGVWPGLFNDGEIIADLEGYFLMDDYWDDEFNNLFHPIKSDTTVTGLGIEVSVRYMQFDSMGLEDVFFRIYDITNNSDYDYEKVFLGDVVGTIMGGNGDSQDDMASIDRETQIIYSHDLDGIGNIGQRTATMGMGFLETPSYTNIDMFNFFENSESPDLSDDSQLWRFFIFHHPLKEGPHYPMDGDLSYNTNIFSLNSKETKRVVSVIAFDYKKIEWKKKYFWPEKCGKINLILIN